MTEHTGFLNLLLLSSSFPMNKLYSEGFSETYFSSKSALLSLRLIWDTYAAVILKKKKKKIINLIPATGNLLFKPRICAISACESAYISFAYFCGKFCI